MPRLPRFPLYGAILVAMLAGAAIGPQLGTDAAPLGELGKLVIQLIKGIATPLLFLSILSGILHTELGARSGVRMLGFSSLNATLALGLGLLLSNLLQPGRHLATAIPQPDAAVLEQYASKKLDLVKTVASYVPADLVTPFAQNTVLSVILIALFLGFGLRRVRAEQLAQGGTAHRVIEDAVATLQRVAEVVLGWAVKLIPLAVFGVVAKTVGEYGFAPLRGLAWYVAVGLAGLALHAIVTYQLWLALWVRLPLRRFWSAAREPMATALGTNSSLATLPVTLQALGRLGVSREASTLGACVGTNLNNDGIILYEGMAVLFVAQAYGIDLSLGEQLLAAVTCLVAAVGVAGVPEAGFVSLALVVNTVGLPIEILPLLLTVDWIIARARSVINVLSDMLLSILIDHGDSLRAP